MADTVRVATAYLQVEGRAPGHTNYRHQAAVRGVSNSKPEVVKPGCIVVKVQLRIPAEAWEPFAPEAVIDVPAELIQRPIAVEAVDAND